MSHDLINDADPVAGPPLPGISAAGLRQARRWLTAAAVVIALLFLGRWLIGIYADWLWYNQLGYGHVFITILSVKATIFAVGGLMAATLVSLNLAIVLPLSWARSPEYCRRIF